MNGSTVNLATVPSCSIHAEAAELVWPEGSHTGGHCLCSCSACGLCGGDLLRPGSTCAMLSACLWEDFALRPCRKETEHHVQIDQNHPRDRRDIQSAFRSRDTNLRTAACCGSQRSGRRAVKFALAGRVEYLSDRGGLFSGATQALK